MTQEIHFNCLNGQSKKKKMNIYGLGVTMLNFLKIDRVRKKFRDLWCLDFNFLYWVKKKHLIVKYFCRLWTDWIYNNNKRLESKIWTLISSIPAYTSINIDMIPVMLRLRFFQKAVFIVCYRVFSKIWNV